MHRRSKAQYTGIGEWTSRRIELMKYFHRQSVFPADVEIHVANCLIRRKTGRLLQKRIVSQPACRRRVGDLCARNQITIPDFEIQEFDRRRVDLTGRDRLGEVQLRKVDEGSGASIVRQVQRHSDARGTTECIPGTDSLISAEKEKLVLQNRPAECAAKSVVAQF